VPSTLKYDPTTPEGEAISGLFRSFKSVEDGDDYNEHVVDEVRYWLIELGIDPNGTVYQVDPIPPEVVSPEATAVIVTRLLILAGPVLTDGQPTSHEGYFHAEVDPDCCDECVTVTFTTAPAARIRFALTWLRQSGYNAHEQPTPNPSAARAVHVRHGALYPRPADASTEQTAARILWLSGFTTAPEGERPDVVGPAAPTPVHWRPGWVQIDIAAPRTTGRDEREEAARAAAEAFTDHGWQVEYHGTDTLHARPAPQDPPIAAEPVPAAPGDPNPSTTPETRAASLFVAAFNTVYEDDPRMTIALHMSSGSSLAVTGELDNWRMRFHPAEVSTLLAWLTRAVATDPVAIITVTADRDEDGETAHGWAWCIATGAALDTKGAAPLFDADVELRGAEQRHVVLSGLVDISADGLSATALTDEVKALVSAHGEPSQHAPRPAPAPTGTP
jgi:hypothetical protein